MQSKLVVDVVVVTGEINGNLNIEPKPMPIRLPKLFEEIFFFGFK